jgi:hypothetical protein
MGQEYSNPDSESDKWSLPDIEVFELTAREVAAMDEDLVHEYMKMGRFKLAAMNSKIRETMFDCMIDMECIKGGWFYWYCLPGCMPDSSPFGPYDSLAEALKAAQEDAAE